MGFSKTILAATLKNTLTITFLSITGSIANHSATKSSLPVETDTKPSVSTAQCIDKLTCRDCHKMYLKREKSLKSVKSLLDHYTIPTSTAPTQKIIQSTQKEIDLVENKRVSAKIAALTKLYKKQYEKISRQLPRQDPNKKFQSIVGEMRSLLDQLDQKELSYVVKYQKALHCHELFGALERMLTKDNSLQDLSYDPLNSNEKEANPEIITSIAGLPEQAPRKKVRKPRPDEMVDYGPSLVIPASVGMKHGLDRLIDGDPLDK